MVKSRTSALLISSHKTLYIENEFFNEKEESAFDLFMCPNGQNVNNNSDIKKKNENKPETIEENEKAENIIKKEALFKNNDIIKTGKNEIKNDEIEKKIQENKIIENNNIKNNTKEIVNKSTKNDNSFKQTFSRSDFKDKPPKVSQLFLHAFDYENINTFSLLNDSIGKINESKKVPIVFYNHLFIHNENNNNKRYVLTSMNKRHNEKALTLLYYAP